MTMDAALLGFALLAGSSGAQPAPAIPEADRVRIAEAFRLADAIGNRVWPGWDKAPFAVLLVTPDREFLIRHPKPSDDFALAGALAARQKPEFPDRLAAYGEARRTFRSLLAADDYKYFAFQVWKEGVARYTEYRLASLAAAGYEPSKAFQGLKDYRSFAEVAQDMLSRVEKDLESMRLAEAGRTVVYNFGAAEGLVLDRARPEWRKRYFEERFSLDGHFTR